MKYISLSFLITFSLLILSCSDDHELKTVPTSIAFVHEDGTAILPNECINPNTNYALLIKTSSEGTGDFKPIKIEYTLNGAPYVMSFSTEGEQLNRIKLIDGLNKAEIIGSDYKTSLFFNSHENFELVE